MTPLERAARASRKLVCCLKGHDYSRKLVWSLPYVQAYLETCDRCGSGEDVFRECKEIEAADKLRQRRIGWK